jgi:hypothetical protein
MMQHLFLQVRRMGALRLQQMWQQRSGSLQSPHHPLLPPSQHPLAEVIAAVAPLQHPVRQQGLSRGQA